MKCCGNRLKRDTKLSLQQKTLVMLIILLFFFFTMFMVATYIISNKAEQDFQIRTSDTAVNNVASNIISSLENYNYILRRIMVNDSVVSFLHAKVIDKSMQYEARMVIYGTYSMYNNIDSVYIFRNDGERVSTGQGKYEVNINSTERTKILDARGTTVVSINGNGTIKKDGAKPMLTMSRAIYDIYSQKLLGILVMNVTSNVFDESMALQNMDEMCILDTSGTVLCGNEKIGALYSNVYNSDSLVHRNINLDGEQKTLTGRLAVKPLVVLCACGKGVEGLPRDTTYALMLTLSAFILSCLVCAWFITKNIARPIKNLSAAMERTKSSGWLKRIDEKMPNNEIGRLAESYNSMIEYLNELFNRLLEDEKNVQKAEMRVLQEQIKPHFLYNSLETISYMAVEENATRVQDVLETLGSFYRNFLSKGDREIPLKRELRITQDYLSLQKLRYGNAFEDQYIIDDNTLDYMVPKLILQPLVENSIYHGVRLKGEKCIISITTRMEEDGLHIIVYDSGVGMSNEKIQSVLKVSKDKEVNELSGFGLRGTIDRIRYFCDYENVIQIHSETGEYTEIEIYIPKKRDTKTEGE